MKRLSVAVALWLALATSPGFAADAGLYAVPGVAVDATSNSAAAARDIALAQGRPIAWQRLYRRLTPPDAWGNQPNPDGATLERMILSMEIGNERRSTTRYLAEVTYNFNPNEVQALLRRSSIPFADARARPVLVVPIMNGSFDPQSPWAQAWTQPSIAQGLVPVVLPNGDALDQPVLGQPGLGGLGWDQLAPLAERYDVAGVVIATATPDGNAAQLSIVGPTGRQVESLAFAQSSFGATADAAAQRIAEDWKERAAVDYSRRSRLTADVVFARPGDWPAIRQRLASVGTVAGVDVLGISTTEARVELSYFGEPEQLSDAMAEQNLNFAPAQGGYLLRLGPPAPNRQ
ncbi:MAG: hypothetical protein RJB62_552 [Pseudomonadota bacterium]|jgi:hypothetical protein